MIFLHHSVQAPSRFGLSIVGLIFNGLLLMKASHIISKLNRRRCFSQEMRKAKKILKGCVIKAKLGSVDRAPQERGLFVS